MKKPLRALLVEDCEDDAELLLRELSRSGYEVEHIRVDTADALREALATREWDVVLSDYNMPEFDARAALGVLKESGSDLPFIIISGAIGEETAVGALKAGAHDFLVKGRLTRLAPAVERELREVEVRRERREAIAQVREREGRLSAIFSQVAVGIALINLDGRIGSANQRFSDLVGRPFDVMRSLRDEDMTHPDDAAATASAFERLAGGHSSQIEKRYVRPDGSTVWVSETLSSVSGADGRPEHSVAVIQDITDRKRAEQELREAVKARDEFLSIASHELRTPVTALELNLASVMLLVRNPGPGVDLPEKLAGKLVRASRQVDRLTALISSLLDVTRITAGRISLCPVELDLSDLVRAVALRFREMIQRSESKLVVRAEQPVAGCWDAMALETVIGNLLSNAIKFGSGRPIEVAVERYDRLARLTVIDHGIGIAEEQQVRIFERFERAVSARHYGGFGIGLWVARHLVEAHGGGIEVASRPGEGSRFTVQLPLEDTARVALPRASGEAMVEEHVAGGAIG
ncbi:MAG TPA: ATP-binding protein [Kofleriaceae bacterium]|nr:ATP-binding protein [Kofleriaceae bacterium]